MIHADRSDPVFACVRRLLDELSPANEYRGLFDLALRLVRDAAESSNVFLPIDLPLAVADAIALPERERHVAAAASMLLWSGADLMDDAADGQLPEEWNGVRASTLALVATNLLATLPHLLVSSLEEDAASSLYSDAASRTLFMMSDGQAADLASGSAVQSVDDYLAMIRRKSGAEFALFASTPAMLRSAGGGDIGRWTRFGLEYGMMSQAFSDIVSTVTEDSRNDLFSGKRTLPVLLTLQATGDSSHTTFVSDLDKAAAGDHIALSRAVQCMTGAGAIRASFEQVERMRFRAMQALPVKLTDLGQDHPLRQLLQLCRVV